MPHPMIRKLAAAGALGALALPIPGSAAGLGVEPAAQVLTEEDCALLDAVELTAHPECPVPDPTAGTAEAAEAAAAAVTDGIDQVSGIVAGAPPLLLPPLPSDAPAPEPAPAAPDDDHGTATPPQVPASATVDGSPAATPTQSNHYAAAGKDPVEVLEPGSPASDGRVESSTLDPTALGSNIPGVRSESSLTLQPFAAPVVAPDPVVIHAPVIAPDPAAATGPIMVAEAVEWAGAALVGTVAHDTGWAWALALGLTAVGAVAARRRYAVDLIDR